MEEKDSMQLLPLDRESCVDQVSGTDLGRDEEAFKDGYAAAHHASFHHNRHHTLELSSQDLGSNFDAEPALPTAQRWKEQVCAHRSILVASVALVIVLLLVLGIAFELEHDQQKLGPVASGGVEAITQYRTAFHFQPAAFWMNDPNGPVFYKSFYHLFFQFNPLAAIWGNITWGHAISKDLVHWTICPVALEPDHWYDQQGVWSGSATVLQDGSIVLAYTGSTNQLMQVQNLAVPANASDPLLRTWTKSPQNPIIQPPPGVNGLDFRDPTTAWLGGDGRWRMLVGARVAGSGAALMYTSTDFRNWTLTSQPLHSVSGSPMWECPDFYPVARNSGLPLGDFGLSTPYVLKASIDHTLTDSYSLGFYNNSTNTWTPKGLDVSRNRLLDYGKYYASKSFFDPVKKRRILFGWIYETDSQQSNIKRGWASVQALPRSILLDEDEGDIVQWPVEEVEVLRQHRVTLANVTLQPGLQVDLPGLAGCQLDLELSFAIPTLNTGIEAWQVAQEPPEDLSNCRPEGAARTDGLLGPFGVAFLARGVELTVAYFELALNGTTWTTRICTDVSRASLAPDTDRGVYGSMVKVDVGQGSMNMRVLIDHSVVEVFAQMGRTVITTRSYPVEAMSRDARVFLFNNGTNEVELQQISAWQMSPIEITNIGLD